MSTYVLETRLSILLLLFNLMYTAPLKKDCDFSNYRKLGHREVK